MRPGSYAAAGVDIAAQDRAIDLFREAVRSTYTNAVVTDVGAFGGMWAFDSSRYDHPLLVSSVDSVGTKVMVAAAAGRHRGIGLDLIHHCANDIAVMGAEPVFFLDYYATAHLDPEQAAEVIAGLAEGCRGIGCALIGGELAELPGMYVEGVYDLAGCIVGIVDRKDVLTGREVVAGDVILGLASSGLHTNGYSLAREVLLGGGGPGLGGTVSNTGQTVGEALLEPHRCYVPALRRLREAGVLKAAAHITGGGVFDNLPRVLPDGLGAELRRGSWVEPAFFGLIAELGSIEAGEMFHTFNMGLGLLAIVSSTDRQIALDSLAGIGYAAGEVGGITAGGGVVIVEPGRTTPIGR